MKESQIVIGIDPGYDRVGWAVGRVERRQLHLIDAGCIQTNPQAKVFDRFQQIKTELSQICRQYQPNRVGVETLFFSRNTTTAIRVAEARGLILGVLLDFGAEIHELNPNSIKLSVTGNGRANKAAVEKMVRLQTKLPAKKLIDDAIDAVAAAMTLAVN